MLETVSSEVNSDGSHFLLISYGDISCILSSLVSSEGILLAFSKFAQGPNIEPRGRRWCVSANARMN